MLFLKRKQGEGIYVGDSFVQFDHFADGIGHFTIRDGDIERTWYMRPQYKPYWFRNGTRMALEDYVGGVVTLSFDAPEDVKIDRDDIEEI